MTDSIRTYHAEVFVTLKRLVNDPEGIEIRNGLHNLGYSGVEEVRAGKYFELAIAAGSVAEAQDVVNEMAERLLCNTVIEDYRVVIREESVVN